MSIPLHVVDAFTATPFAGNPAAVCLLARPAEAAWMQLVAREMGHSETAFLHSEGKGWRLRWFTPKMEVDLCGHATLAAAHVLWETGRLGAEERADFHSASGLLSATRHDDWIELDFPSTPPWPEAAPEELAMALRCAPRHVERSSHDYLVEVDSEAVVRGLAPDFEALEQLLVRGVIVTARSMSPDFDFVSRFFAPSAGVNEDPVTGSAHCALAPYWSQRLAKDEMVAFQASARGGVVRVRMAGDRVRLSGQAVTVLRAELAC